MNGSDNEVQIGSGKSPEGVLVTYFEVDRPGTVGARGAQGYVVEVRNADGNRLTHSDSLEGLKKAGFTVDAAPAPVVPPVAPPAVVPPTPVPVPAAEKSIEDELAS